MIGRDLIMQRNPSALSNGLFDLLIIGGGIYGAGVARDAALRGLRAALVDQADFASGTSSRSSKLIHGGFRYLEHYDFSLVAESTRERRILRQIAPHRVHPLPLLLPVYRGGQRPLWLLRIGMTLYDALALYRNVEPHRTLSAQSAAELEPALRRENLIGAIRYFDCQEDDARFCVDNILHAAKLGAACVNYCRITGFSRENGRINVARALDALTGQTFVIRAKMFINAAGPWVERVAAMAGAGDGAAGSRSTSPRLSPTKGTHILLPRLTQSHGIFFQAKQDGRMMFVLPWNNCTLVGTTDTDFAGDPASVAPDAADIEYLLAEARHLFPAASLTASDIIASFAGIRPLLASDSANPSARSRDHQILRLGENLLSIAGGKYTTYRLIARQTVDAACRILGMRPPPCITHRSPIPNDRPPPRGAQLADHPEVFESDVRHAVAAEMAMSVDDIMARRTGMALSRFGTSDMREQVRRIAFGPDTSGAVLSGPARGFESGEPAQ